MIPEDRPENVDFQIDDLNARFTFSPGQFDLVHSQMMSGGIDADRWPTYIEDIFHVLRPGVHALSLWSERYLASLDPYKDPRAGLKLNEWMKSTGFTQVERRIIYLPMSPWQIGYVNSENIAQLLHSLALYPFTKLSGIPTNMFEQLVDAARGEAADTSYKAYFPLYITTGRKPVA
ncbi:hypothetical protein ED733_001487 [Metarhizium rileyi]|uniref:Uncharacterized protein n=1 Tax=Metarhizium rileyi (strain RCEF 4871) TaxID=1649241 RepID=A0A5C6FZ52_METRR|nr:hypothetical protein ED733_001487 [Metarhizium rileyi]